MRIKKPVFTTGRVTNEQAGGNYNVRIGGVSSDTSKIPSGYRLGERENVLVCYLDDDTPIILGRAGYITPL